MERGFDDEEENEDDEDENEDGGDEDEDDLVGCSRGSQR